MKTIIINSKLYLSCLLCFLFCTVNLFAEKIPLSSGESQIIKSDEVPVGLDASSWEKIQEQIRDPKIITFDTDQEIQNPKSKIQNLSAPIYGGEVKLTASDAQTEDYFGRYVAVAGDVAIVGASGEDTCGIRAGAAYIFERNAGGADVWGEVKKLTASDAAPFDYFGVSVAVDGDVAVVGATGEDAGGSFAGAAYVFERNATGGTNNWREVKKLTAYAAEAGDGFGNSVAVAGNVVIVGANRESSGGTNAGAAYIFERNVGGNDVWGEVKKLTASDAHKEDNFGCFVAVAGNVVVVGAFGEDSGGIDAGAAYVFERNTNGEINNWGEVEKLTASDPHYADYFGRSVAVAGNVIIIGANGKAFSAGAAYIFNRNTNGVNAWRETIKLNAFDAQANDNFGFSVAVAGDEAVVGAYKNGSAGAAYVFKRNMDGTNTWDEVKKLTASDAQADDWFGIAVAAAGDIVVVGASKASPAGALSGAAYVMPIVDEAKDFCEVAKLTASDAAANDYFGYSVAVAGSVAVIGAYGENTGGNYAGAAYVFERDIGGISAWGQVKKLIASDAFSYDRFGYSVAVAGDVVIVGAVFGGGDFSGGSIGEAYIYERNAGGLSAWGEVKKLTASDAQDNDNFGCSVAIAGDVAIVGAFKEDSGGINAGAAYVFERNANGSINNWGEVKKLTASNSQMSNYFGRSVAVAADVVVVGMNGEELGGALVGGAYVFERNANGGTNNWEEVKQLMASDVIAGDNFGWSVAVAGDVAIVGAKRKDVGEVGDAGAAYVFERNANGSTDNWGEVKKLTASNPGISDWFGHSVAVAGDVALVGAFRGDGKVYTFQRNANGTNAWGETKILIASDLQWGDSFGWSVGVAGDVVIVGSFGEDSAADYAGAAYIFEDFAVLIPEPSAFGAVISYLLLVLGICRKFIPIAVT